MYVLECLRKKIRVEKKKKKNPNFLKKKPGENMGDFPVFEEP